MQDSCGAELERYRKRRLNFVRKESGWPPTANRFSETFHDLQNGPVILPLLPLFCQERDEAGILSKVIQIGIRLEQRITRQAVPSRHLQPLDRLLGFIHERISTGDVIGRMMEVAKTLSSFYS
jgi:hypothetical protein